MYTLLHREMYSSGLVAADLPTTTPCRRGLQTHKREWGRPKHGRVPALARHTFHGDIALHRPCPRKVVAAILDDSDGHARVLDHPVAQHARIHSNAFGRIALLARVLCAQVDIRADSCGEQ